MSLAPSAVVPIPRRGMPWPRELLYAWNCLPAAFGDRDEFEGLAEGLVSLEAPAQPAEPDALVSLHSAVTGTGGVHLWMPSHASAAEVCDETLFQLNSDSADTAAELCQQLRRDGAASKFHFNSEYSPGQVRLMQNDGEVRRGEIEFKKIPWHFDRKNGYLLVLCQVRQAAAERGGNGDCFLLYRSGGRAESLGAKFSLPPSLVKQSASKLTHTTILLKVPNT